MNHKEQRVARINKIKTYLEVNFNNFNESNVLRGIDFCEEWLKVLNESNNISSDILKQLQSQANSLERSNHGLEEIKYEFAKWLREIT